jgi:hypothetical protein
MLCCLIPKHEMTPFAVISLFIVEFMQKTGLSWDISHPGLLFQVEGIKSYKSCGTSTLANACCFFTLWSLSSPSEDLEWFLGM